ncbi:MAG TPA: hypothetical protein VFW98_16915 [Gemmatimonadaceae bacterium]|nr:hypothetical protein [Gemmatimonadaceae bacterium]
MPPMLAARHSRVRRAIAAAALATCLPASAAPQELSGLAGVTWDARMPRSSYAWQIEYAQELGDHILLAGSWLNEGHIEGHHRDGYTVQLGARTSVGSPQLFIGVTGGVYRYFDTIDRPVGDYANHHAWGTALSGRASYVVARRLLLRVGVMRTWADARSIDSWMALFGMGYRPQPPNGPGGRARPAARDARTTDNEITLFVGRTVVNSFSNERSAALALEYRRGIGRYIDWSIAVIDEGDPAIIRRNGLVTQLWVIRSFLNDRMTLGLGAGPYLAIDEKREPGPGGHGTGTVAELVTPTVSWRIARAFLLRFNWERTITSYDADTDIFLFGLGYRF